MAGDLEETTVNCVDAWVAKLLDGKTLAESEVVQLCNKVSNHVHVQQDQPLVVYLFMGESIAHRNTVRKGDNGQDKLIRHRCNQCTPSSLVLLSSFVLDSGGTSKALKQ